MQSKKGSIVWDCATKIIEDDTYMLNFKHSYEVTIKKCKFKTTNTSHVEMIRTAKRQIYKSHLKE